MKPVLVLMNGALRLDDHPALAKACATGAPVIPVFILDDAAAGDWKLGGAKRWWLRESLIALSSELESKGSALVRRSGNTLDILMALIEETGAGALHMTRAYEPHLAKLQDAVYDLAEELGVTCRRFAGNLLLEPEQVRNKTGGVYEVFSPFWRRALELIDGTTPTPAPEDIPAPETWPESYTLDLDPKPAHWPSRLRPSGHRGRPPRMNALRTFWTARWPSIRTCATYRQ